MNLGSGQRRFGGKGGAASEEGEQGDNAGFEWGAGQHEMLSPGEYEAGWEMHLACR